MVPSRRQYIAGIVFLGIFTELFWNIHGQTEDQNETWDIVGKESVLLAKFLQFKYKPMNRNCHSPYKQRIDCIDIRLCQHAKATLAMGGWPTMCEWDPDGIVKVCCGMPLVLGESLMKKVLEEKSRNRKCGTRSYEPNLSETERTFFNMSASIPKFRLNEVDYDPPLDFNAISGSSDAVEKESYQGKFPWMICIRKKGAHWCSGALIDRVHVLTDAHCFLPDLNAETNLDDYSIHVGDIYGDKAYEYSIKRIVIHPKFVRDIYYHNLAMFTLNEEILHPRIAHICLPSPEMGTMDLIGKNTTLLGWGYTSFRGEANDQLRVNDNLPVIPYGLCRRIYRRSTRQPEGLTEDFICAGLQDGGKDTCQRDYGSPLMYSHRRNSQISEDEYTLVGLFSFGFRCGEVGIPGVYTKIANYMDWITETMNE